MIKTAVCSPYTTGGLSPFCVRFGRVDGGRGSIADACPKRLFFFSRDTRFPRATEETACVHPGASDGKAEEALHLVESAVYYATHFQKPSQSPREEGRERERETGREVPRNSDYFRGLLFGQTPLSFFLFVKHSARSIRVCSPLLGEKVFGVPRIVGTARLSAVSLSVAFPVPWCLSFPSLGSPASWRQSRKHGEATSTDRQRSKNKGKESFPSSL